MTVSPSRLACVEESDFLLACPSPSSLVLVGVMLSRAFGLGFGVLHDVVMSDLSDLSSPDNDATPNVVRAS